MAKSDEKSDKEIIKILEKKEVLEMTSDEKYGAILGYRLAESEQESKYRKLVEGLMAMVPTSIHVGIASIDVINYHRVHDLITEIEGGDNDKAKGVRRGK